MSPDQLAHLERLNRKFCIKNKAKYELGVTEHQGTNLWDLDILPLLYNIREEAIDQFNYVQTLIDKLEADGE